MARAEILELTPLHRGYVRLYTAKVRLPDGAVVERELVETGDAACVLAYDPDRRVALVVSTPRIPVIHAEGSGASLTEAVAGMLDGDPAEACARKEAMEETGLELGELEPVGRAWSSPGTSAERISLFLASYGEADRTGAGGGADAEHENIAIREIPLTEPWAELHARGDVDLKTLALAQALRLRRPDLFEVLGE
jgi:nudix-type nucleoside diphosphatase (YffH/AdpP family)